MQSLYFNPPHHSRASKAASLTSNSGRMPVPVQVHISLPTGRSSASAAANHEHHHQGGNVYSNLKDKSGKGPVVAPVMRRCDSSSSSSGSSYDWTPTQTVKTKQSLSTMSATPGRLRPRRQSLASCNPSYPPRPSQVPHSQSESNVGANANSSPNSIPHLREALNTLESQMASLMSERRRLETRLEHAVRQQSPITRLPRELLGTIFVIGVHRTSIRGSPSSTGSSIVGAVDGGTSSGSEEDAILLSTLMCVCREWTDIALNTPELWAHITIDSTPRTLLRAKRKLSRSKAVPLEIAINFGPGSQHPPRRRRRSHEHHTERSRREEVDDVAEEGEKSVPVMETLVHALDLLRPAIWRWRSFRVAVPTRAHAHAVLAPCRETAPLLEFFSVHVHQVATSDLHDRSAASTGQGLGGLGIELFAGRVPRLSEVALTSFSPGWESGVLRKLRVLKLGGFWNVCAPSVSAITTILRQCPALEELVLRSMSDVEPLELCSSKDALGYDTFDKAMFPRECDMIALPRLKRASFYYSGVERTTALFAQLSFPALRSLEFAYLDNLTPILKHLKRQAVSLFCIADEGGDEERKVVGLPLERLRVEACFFNELKLLRLLKKLSTLRTLELVETDDVSGHFLSGLSATSSDPYTDPQSSFPCPNLTNLTLDGCGGFPWAALRHLIECRLPPLAGTDARLGSIGAGAHTRGRGMSDDLANGGGGFSRSSSSSSISRSSASAYAASLNSKLSSSPSHSTHLHHLAQRKLAAAGVGMSRASEVHSGAADAFQPHPETHNVGKEGKGVKRLRTVDVTRCPQVGMEMVQWMRMYVAEVRCSGLSGVGAGLGDEEGNERRDDVRDGGAGSGGRFML